MSISFDILGQPGRDNALLVRIDSGQSLTRNFHMTCTWVAELAARAEVGELILFHLSDRYTPEVWREMLREAQHVFPRTRLPGHWAL